MNRPATLAPVAVLGCGVVSPFGLGIEPLLAAIFTGGCGILPRARTAGFVAPTAVAAEFPPDVVAALGGGDDLAFTAAMAAAESALAAGGIGRDRAERARVDFVLASTKGDLRGVLTDQPGTGLGLPARLASRLAAALGLGRCLGAVSCACASGLVALAAAARQLHFAAGERVLVVGVDVLHPFVMAGFGSLHALDPAVCRPFDAARRGVSLGEAAAAVLLAPAAAAPTAPRLLGHGGANDACHVTGPDRQGAGLGWPRRGRSPRPG
jgi:3-oxoacyl-(acyl-carrier-protein) synthase